ncbi:ovochymase-2-like [Lepeophtheirus salmonis]|uniref:ovochymase-2-like n=1 Tax=Lepeophtheirus salmonis TaxID=72036 RepID=UPI001AE63D12|nr:ovochymase-2-like [Lepeophtheirus salmonis]
MKQGRESPTNETPPSKSIHIPQMPAEGFRICCNSTNTSLSVFPVEELGDKLANETLRSDFILITSSQHPVCERYVIQNLPLWLIDKKVVSHITSEGKVNTVIQAINLASFLGAKEELNQTESWEYIQLSGCSNYISVRQILDAEKKIRTLSTVKFSGLGCRTNSGFCMFPFEYHGMHRICTLLNSNYYPKPWCYLNQGGWDYCPDRCFDCGVSNDISNSCDQRKEKTEGQFDNSVFPWHARIVHRFTGEVLCNGVIITNDRVLTTANCQGYYHSDPINIFAGSSTKSSGDGYQNGVIKSAVKHPKYNMKTRENNIAIISLHNKLIWNDRVLPICFSSDYFPIKDTQIATFTGSNIVDQFKYSGLVHFSIVKKLNKNIDEDCQKPDHLCTTKNSVANGRNEGGPLTICQDSTRCVLAGILSVIKEKEHLLVFTDISMHLDWIKKHI